MPAKGVIPIQRGNSRGLAFGGGLGGMGFGNGSPFNGNMRPQQKGGWALGPMFIPPPPPASSKPPPKVIEIAPKQEVKLHEAEKPWKPGRRRVGPKVADSEEPKTEEEILREVCVF